MGTRTDLREIFILFTLMIEFVSAVANVTNTLEEDILNMTSIEAWPEEIMSNSSLLEALSNTTSHRGILHGFTESVSVILVSEIGDKTFFIAAILAMRNNKLVVLLAALSALYVMTILSGLLGWVVTTFIPREITYYTCTAIMFAFALKMFWEAWRMDEDEMEETKREVEQELAELDGSRIQANTAREEGDGGSVCPTGEENAGYEGPGVLHVPTTPQSPSDSQIQPQIQPQSQPQHQSQFHPQTLPQSEPQPQVVYESQPQLNAQEDKSPDEEGKKTKKKNGEIGWVNTAIDRGCKENSWFGKKCLKIFKLFVNTFSLTFIAEWGDRSQLATIVLAGINDVTGVILGGCLGHSVCTGAAVLAGAIIAKYVSIRKITFLGALVFLGFAIASIFIDPNEDGIDGIPEITDYDNITRLINHNISLTIELEEAEGRLFN